MFNRKTSIPNLLGATLALTGCGGDEGSTPKSVMASAQEAFCLKMNACQPSETYRWNSESYARCLEEAEQLNFVSQYVSQECDSLWASYLSCATALPCDALVRFNDYDFTSAEHDACAEEVLYEDPDFAYACYVQILEFFL
jgi:hypothetical protein